jgi:hypothetical protein
MDAERGIHYPDIPPPVFALFDWQRTMPGRQAIRAYQLFDAVALNEANAMGILRGVVKNELRFYYTSTSPGERLNFANGLTQRTYRETLHKAVKAGEAEKIAVLSVVAGEHVRSYLRGPVLAQTLADAYLSGARIVALQGAVDAFHFRRQPEAVFNPDLLEDQVTRLVIGAKILRKTARNIPFKR